VKENVCMGRLVAAVAGLLVACGGEPPAPTAVQGTRSPETPIRLVRLLDQAQVSSPLLELRAAQDLGQLDDVERESLLVEDFEDFDAKAAGWRLAAGSAIEQLGDGSALVLRELGRGGNYGWVLEVEPNTHYRFERRMRCDRAPGADFAVVEATADGKLGIRGPFDNHYMAGRGLALKVHWPEAPVPDGAWHVGETSFFTTPATRALAILVRPTVSKEAARSTHGELQFDDLRLERLAPTPVQAMALFKARSPAQGADPDLGMEKFGQFPPLGEIGDAYDEGDDNYSYRTALYAPPPTELVFDLTVPADAVLHFAVCLARETPPGDGARFEVLAHTEAGSTSLWSREVSAEGEDWRWHDERLALGSLAGRRIQLELRTRALQGHPHPVWGHPVIDAPYTGDGPRNVLLIAVDTLRADHLSCYGYGEPTTPRLDALAADGVRFDQVASNANWTCPSFASIFTGVVPSRHGVYSYGPRTPLPEALLTLAEHFHAAGWATQAIAYKPPLYDGGFEQGFDIAFNVPREVVRGDDNLVEALAWLDANAERRNFLFLHFNDPHQPFTQPAPYITRFGPDPAEQGMSLPYSVYQDGYPRTQAQRDVVRGLYDGEVAYVDDRIGAFLDALEERGLYEDAVIGFVSDHGEQLWEHGGFGHGPTAAGMLYDEVVRVPLIVKPAGPATAPGAVVSTQVRAFDVMPTLLELAGLPVDETLDARSLVPLLAPGSDAPDRVAVIETSGGALALRNPEWKYLLSYGRRARESLFDLTADPGELEDLAEARPEQLALLRLQVLEYLMLRRPGRYLVLLGDGEPAERELAAEGVTDGVTLYGLATRVRDGRATFEGDTDGALWLVASLGAAEPLQLTGHDLPHHEPVRYRRGTLRRLVAEGAPGAHVFLGPAPAAPASRPRATIDARQLELLKAMGYAGDDMEGDER